MDFDEPLRVCHHCGNSHTVRVIWHCVHLWGEDAVDVKAGKAIIANPQVLLSCDSWQSLMRRQAGKLPMWVCLACSPGWSQVHRLAMQDYHWQLEKEEAVAAMNFVRAGELRVLQEKEREGLVALLGEMLGESGAK